MTQEDSINPLDPVRKHMRNVYGLELNDLQIELIINAAAESIVMINQQEEYFEEFTLLDKTKVITTDRTCFDSVESQMEALWFSGKYTVDEIASILELDNNYVYDYCENKLNQ